MHALASFNLPKLLEDVRKAAIAAGAIGMASFRPGLPTSAEIWSKEGGSPVTQADLDVDADLKAACAALRPDAAWLSEETADDPARLTSRWVWVVDPIDGTRAFMAGVPDWCVCVALLCDNEPVLGVVHAPALGVTYEAIAGQGAVANGRGLRIVKGSPVTLPRLAGPKPMLDVLARSFAFSAQPKVPSLALRLARIADGSLDGGLVLPQSRDWDLAASDLVLREAGGRITNLDGKRLAYNQPRPVHATLVAAGDDLHPGLLEAARNMRDTSLARS